HDKVAAWIAEKVYPMGQVMNCLRLAVVGAAMGPDLFEIVSLLGKRETLSRMAKAMEVLDN
ncbi:MAG: glutamate--tRNA ligase, partial [Alistipes sp.]|nr:glutamate--tRNA ligase [Alistipes sp.]